MNIFLFCIVLRLWQQKPLLSCASAIGQDKCAINPEKSVTITCMYMSKTETMIQTTFILFMGMYFVVATLKSSFEACFIVPVYFPNSSRAACLYFFFCIFFYFCCLSRNNFVFNFFLFFLFCVAKNVLDSLLWLLEEN